MRRAPRLHGVTSAAARLGVHRHTLRRWIDAGGVTVTHQAGRDYVSEAEIARLLAIPALYSPEPAAGIRPRIRFHG